ncbi:hypothetical protein [Levilactobacillus mulengensis]|uniref:hypothetical protein n=1 Tax=Levilactobacillus mulengensis TaxID=2486025 RepID=UPI000F76B1AF|nr:hypothetical protein [Levilactobacillus mulengensis]
MLRKEMWQFAGQHYLRLWVLVMALLLTLIAAGFQLKYHVAALGGLDTLAVMLPGLILSTTLSNREASLSPMTRLSLVALISAGYLVLLGGGLFLLLQLPWTNPLTVDTATMTALAYGGATALRGLGVIWLLLVSVGTLQLIVGLYFRRLPSIVPCVVPVLGLITHGILSLTAVPWSYSGVFAMEFMLMLPFLTIAGTGSLVAVYLYLVTHKNRRIPKDSTVHLSE